MPSSTFIDGGSSVLLQYLAAVFALADFPVFFDTTFQNQLFICVEGEGDCFVPSDGSVEGVDFIRHSSSRFGKTFLAFPDRAQHCRAESRIDRVQHGRRGVRTMPSRIGILERLAEGGSSAPAASSTDLADRGYHVPLSAEEAVADLEHASIDASAISNRSSFQLIDLQRQLGIASYLGF